MEFYQNFVSSFTSKQIAVSELQIRGGTEDNSKIIFLISQRKHFWSNLNNLISKDTNMVFYLLCIIGRFKAQRTSRKLKANVFLTALADVALCIMRRFGDIILPIKRRYHGQYMYIANRIQRSCLKALPDDIRATQFYSDMISHNVITPLLSCVFCSRCMINTSGVDKSGPEVIKLFLCSTD